LNDPRSVAAAVIDGRAVANDVGCECATTTGDVKARVAAVAAE
jgi:hypothetical protein